jgi:transposase
MPLPYSDDLRSKLLEAYESGAGSLRQLAARFRVSWGYTKKIRMQQLQTGSKVRVEQTRRGYPSRVGTADRERLCAWLREQPDLSDEELRQRLAGAGVTVCASRVGQLLRQMGVRRKKSRSTRLSGTRKPIAVDAKSFSRPSAQLLRRS